MELPELTQDLKNCQTIGYDASMAVLRQEEANILQRKKVLIILNTVEELSNMIKNGEFKFTKSASIRLFSDGDIELSLWLQKKGVAFKYGCDESMPEYLKVKNIFETIDQPIEGFNHSFDLTPEGLEELKTLWLGPELCIHIEKAMLSGAMGGSTLKKETPVLKI